MSEYRAGISVLEAGRLAQAQATSAASEYSVGGKLLENPVITESSPWYQRYSQIFSENVRKRVAEAQGKLADATPVVCPVALVGAARRDLEAEYHEYRVIWPMWYVPVHAEYVARRAVVNQHMTHALRQYASSYVHYGGDALGYLTAGIRDVTLVVDHDSPEAMHASNEDDRNCRKYFANRLAAADEGWVVPPDVMDAYRKRDAVAKVLMRPDLQCRADAMIVDASVYLMDPLQCAAAMRRHGAQVAMVAVPYDPDMVVSASSGSRSHGTLGTTGVRFVRNADGFQFYYPDGVAGLATMPSRVWFGWICNTIRALPGFPDESYSYELMGVRGPFMVIKVVAMDVPAPVGHRFVYTLRVPGMEGKSLIRTKMLKDLSVDPADPDSWREVEVVVPTRVVEKTYEHALELPAEVFSRQALRSRAETLNDRTVVRGTTVTTHEALTVDQLDVIAYVLYLKAFEARYQSGKLTAAMKSIIDQLSRASEATVAEQIVGVMYAMEASAFDRTFGIVGDAVAGVLDRVRDWFERKPVHQDVIAAVPEVVRFETIVEAAEMTYCSRVSSALASALPADCINWRAPGAVGMSLFSAAEAVVERVPDLWDAVTVRRNGVDLFCDVEDTITVSESTDEVNAFVKELLKINGDDAVKTQHYVNQVFTAVQLGSVGPVLEDNYNFDPDFVNTISMFHDAVFPGMGNIDYYWDPASLIYDDQDRAIAADYMKLPGKPVATVHTAQVYKSRVRAHNSAKRPQNLQELISALSARNLSAPQLAIPQSQLKLRDAVWDNFLDVYCHAGARQLIASYRADPVRLEAAALESWATRAKPETVVKVMNAYLANPVPWEKLRVDEYDTMIKTAVKPPVSAKPVTERLEPQVIVHHSGQINAVFSAIFRVLVRRFEAILRPEIMVNLRKDMEGVRKHVQAHHDWTVPCKYLENDFSKYDKSQQEFALMLEMFVYEQLGLDGDVLKKWEGGHIKTTIRSLAMGVSLSVMYQRKSGDATTAFGNVLINMLSVAYAYRGTEPIWAVFMGDDSLVCAANVVGQDSAAQILAEIFNLQAKYFVTDFPYVLSHFLLIDRESRRVIAVPDPVKRAERLSEAVSARDPQWHERFVSWSDTLRPYQSHENTYLLEASVRGRYDVQGKINITAVCDAFASVVRSEETFRSVWEQVVSEIRY